eukprot:1891182-Pyramimonas_sp.AAC.1
MTASRASIIHARPPEEQWPNPAQRTGRASSRLSTPTIWARGEARTTHECTDRNAVGNQSSQRGCRT